MLDKIFFAELPAWDPEGFALARQQGPTEIYDRLVGRSSGHATEGCLDAIFLMAETEEVLLDPVCSGKVFAGLCAHRRAERWRPD